MRASIEIELTAPDTKRPEAIVGARSFAQKYVCGRASFSVWMKANRAPQDQNLEHEHGGGRRSITFIARTTAQPRDQRPPENHEVHDSRQALHRIARLAQRINWSERSKKPGSLAIIASAVAQGQ